MTIVAGATFGISLIGIAALFGVKLWEHERGVMLMPRARARADMEALHLKALAAAALQDCSALPPYLAHLAHVALHWGALSFARLARLAASRAHQLADMVSHKYQFERRQTRSEFLKKIGERKEGRKE